MNVPGMGSSQRITSLGRELADTVVSEAGKRATYALRGERRCQRCGQALRVARPFCSGCGPAARSHINAFKQQAPRILQAHGPASAEWGQFMAAFWAASGVPITFALAQIPEAGHGLDAPQGVLRHG